MWPHDVLLDLPSQRLAQMLLHFVWQGALVAAVYSLAIEWVREHASAYRTGAYAV